MSNEVALEKLENIQLKKVIKGETNGSKSNVGTSNFSLDIDKTSNAQATEPWQMKPKTRWNKLAYLIFYGKERKVDDAFQKMRSLGAPYARVIHQWGMAVGCVIVGEYAGWNFALNFGWGSMIIATIIATYLYWALILCLSEMSAALPFTGGPSLFATAAFGSLTGTIIGYSYLFEFLLAGASDFVSTCQALQAFLEFDESLTPLVFFILIVVFSMTNFNKQPSFRLAVYLTMVAFFGVFVFVVPMFPKVMPSFEALYINSTSNFTSLSTEVFFPEGVPGVLSCLPFAIWLFLGIEILPLCSEETIQPETTNPRGLISSMTSLTAVAYLTLLFIPLVPPGASVIASSSQAYVDAFVAAYNITSVPATKVLQFLNLFGNLCTLQTDVYSYSRHVYALSRGGHLPVGLSITNPKTGGPIRATIFGSLVVFICFIITWFSELDFLNIFLLNGSVMFALLSYTGEFLAFIVLRHKMPNIIRPFKNPLGVPGAAVGACLSVISFVSCMVYFDMFRLSGVVCLVMVLVVIPYYIFFARKWLVLTPEKVFVEANLKEKTTQRF